MKGREGTYPGKDCWENGLRSDLAEMEGLGIIRMELTVASFHHVIYQTDQIMHGEWSAELLGFGSLLDAFSILSL
jgi:hypothetical protein